MLKFAAILPHPPIIIPTIGSPSDLKKVEKTIKALEKIREDFDKKEIETLFLISPHGPVSFEAMGMIVEEKLEGNFSMFGDFFTQLSFSNDLELCSKIEKSCQKENIPLSKYKNLSLDHGCLVPLWYLTKNKKPKLVPLAYSLLDRKTHIKFGKILGKIAKNSPKKIGIVASGDLSHRLTPSAPAGFSEKGAEFDQKIVSYLKEGKFEEIIKMEEDLVEEAGECGYRSILILLGALSTLEKVKFEILSYEGPFGVGYLVAKAVGL